MTDRNANHIIPSYYHLTVSYISLVDQWTDLFIIIIVSGVDVIIIVLLLLIIIIIIKHISVFINIKGKPVKVK